MKFRNKKSFKEAEPILSESDLTSFKDVLAPDSIDEKELHMEIGRNYVQTICVYDYPKRLYGNWLSRLRRFQGNLSISFHIEKIPSSEMIKHLRSAIPELESRTVSADEEKKRNALLDFKDATRLMDKLIESDNDAMFRVHMYLNIHAESIAELSRLRERVLGALRRVKLKGTLVKYRSAQAFQSTLPLMANHVPDVTFRNMDVEAVSSVFPFDDSEIFNQSKYSVVKGKNITTGSIVLVDHFALANHNEFSAGFSGMAKTTTMTSDMLRHWIQGVRNFIIDPEGEFTGIVKSLGGTVVTVSNMSKTVINPLEIMNTAVTDSKNLDTVEDDDQDIELVGSLIDQKIQRLKILFKSIKKDLSQVEEALLEQVLIKTYAAKEITFKTDFRELTSESFPTFSDLYEQINKLPKEEADELRQFKLIFKTYVSGTNSKLFNGHTKVDLKNDLISFDLKHLEDGSDLKRAAMYNVITFLWDEITKDKTQPKRLYIDECHVLADPDHPMLMKFVYQIYKRIRKYFGGCTVTTQQIDDYLSASDGKRNYGAAIIENSYTKFILGLEEKGIDDLVSRGGVSLSESEIDILKRKQKGKGIYCIGTKRVYMEVIQSQEEMRLFDKVRYQETYKKDASIVPDYDISDIKREVL